MSTFADCTGELLTIGHKPEAATAVMAAVCRHEAERLEMDTIGGIYAGRNLIRETAREAQEVGEFPKPAFSAGYTKVSRDRH